MNLLWAAKEVGLIEGYGTMYRYTSAVAHGRDITSHFFVSAGDHAPTLKLSPGDDHIKPVIESSIVTMHIIVSDIDRAFGLDEVDPLAKISADLPQKRAK